MNTILTAVLGAFGGAIFTAIAIGAKRIIGLTEAVKALSHDALFTRCEALIRQGDITPAELENLTILFDAYHKQGLNGSGEELYHRAKSLPLDTKTE